MSAKRVVIGLSGGVDSSVAALLLKEQGYEPVGLFLRNWHEEDECGRCTADDDYADVRRVADKLGIDYYAEDFSEEYLDRVFKGFVEEYKKGRTPNPDVLCNREIKFDAFAAFARTLGASYVATGHYADLSHEGGRHRLLRSRDENKDQTYFLNQVTEEQIANAIFPLGALEKGEVRAIAKKAGLPVWEKKDSTGICFIGERNFRAFLSQYIPMQKGEIVTTEGKVVGEHEGVFYYTLGQRKGLGVGGGGNGEPWFVVEKDVLNNRLIVTQGETDLLYSSALTVDHFHFIADRLPEGESRVLARIRHRQPLQKATAIVEGDRVRVVFDEPQRAVAEGQYCVLYDNRVCLGGGVIENKSPIKREES
ncbi:MAG TPA: tRNA 2-thiouridine(34) synthase MnmA [Clostridiales bacterium]|nr:tRNA 2-thiouridine(34) synthase MnmA [Clostridiales bacterium]